MKVETTHMSDSSVHVLTINGVEQNQRCIGIEEIISIRDKNFKNGDRGIVSGKALVYKANLLIGDKGEASVHRMRASIASKGRGEAVGIPSFGIVLDRVDDCLSIEVNDKKRYAGDGIGGIGLVGDSEGE